MALFYSPLLIVHAVRSGAGHGQLAAVSVFIVSLLLLYGSSTIFHYFEQESPAGMMRKRMDHLMIFVLIAGTYTPVCVCAMGAPGRILLIVVWSIAAVGMLFKFLWVTCPKWVSSVIYIGLGWAILFALPSFAACVSPFTLFWIAAGGVIYTIGGVIYALKLKSFNSRDSLWGSHEIFHLFVMAGSLCHFIGVFSIF